MVFQNYALYPHMTVRENMGFALKLAKTPQREIDSKVAEAAKILDLEQHLDRKPANLSGGQRQRVAMGRAIVRSPKVFLMDEPLSNLDAKPRVQMRTEISRIQQQLETTTIYVTHDQTEAMTLGDRIAVMRAGILQQVGPPSELYGHPSNLFVAGLIGSPSMNFLAGEITGDSVHLPIGEVRIPDELRRRLEGGPGGGRRVIAGLRPEHFEDAALVPDRSKGTGVQGQDRRARIDGLRVLRLFLRCLRGGVLHRARRAGGGHRRRRPAPRARRRPGDCTPGGREPGAAGPGSRAVVRREAFAAVRPRVGTQPPRSGRGADCDADCGDDHLADNPAGQHSAVAGQGRAHRARGSNLKRRPAEARDEIQLSDLEDYALLAEMVDAWGFRAMQSRGEAINRTKNAVLWLETEFRPVVAMVREAGLVGDRTGAPYMRIAGERYWLLRTHEWSDEMLQQVI